MRKRKEIGGEHQRLLDANKEYEAEIRRLRQELHFKEIELNADDIVITSNNRPVALAGAMGGNICSNIRKEENNLKR